jgi:hypothetical protein
MRASNLRRAFPSPPLPRSGIAAASGIAMNLRRMDQLSEHEADSGEEVGSLRYQTLVCNAREPTTPQSPNDKRAD